MSSLRLNMGIRSDIVAAALARKFPKESIEENSKTIREKETDFTIKVFEEMVGANLLKKIRESNLEDHFTFNNHFSARIRLHNSYVMYIQTRNDIKNKNVYKFYSSRLIAYYTNSNPYQIKNQKLSESLLKFLDEREKFDKEYSETKQKLESFLNNFTTLNQVIKEWPEGEPFYRKWLETSTKRNVPMIIVSDLNKALGLPLKKSEDTEDLVVNS